MAVFCALSKERTSHHRKPSVHVQHRSSGRTQRAAAAFVNGRDSVESCRAVTISPKYVQ